MDHLDTIVTVIVAVFFAGMGVYGLVTPNRLVSPFGIALDSVTARSEVRAVYGGFGLAIAGVLGTAVVRADLRAGIVVTVAAALAAWPSVD